MQELKNRIKNDGHIISESILKVDSFLNHQIDWKLMENIGIEFHKIFGHLKIDKIVTIEASGIVIGVMVAKALNLPLVYAKKGKPSTLSKAFCTQVFSFTKQKNSDISISKEYLKKDENILVVDDFLASGNAIIGLLDLITQAQANLIGVGIVIEKSFQTGRKRLKALDINLHSLAQIESLQDGKVKFL
ncbi:MAG: xanthine phosphoribosyltransferase [Candidatus Cloacimonadota bacterium]|nr:MAG: xanthine phosphoribosyltransferase [Candidatus Cloacimonadota bacterium]